MTPQLRSLLLLAYVIAVIDTTLSDEIFKETPCHTDMLDECSSTEICVMLRQMDSNNNHEANGICKCRNDTIRNRQGHCVPSPAASQHSSDPILPPAESLNSNQSSSSSVVVGTLVPLFLIALVILGVIGWRNRWHERFRQPRVRQYDTVLVGAHEDNDDDPPIA